MYVCMYIGRWATLDDVDDVSNQDLIFQIILYPLQFLYSFLQLTHLQGNIQIIALSNTGLLTNAEKKKEMLLNETQKRGGNEDELCICIFVYLSFNLFTISFLL